MLEGKELEGKIGEYGQYSVDLKPDGNVEGDVTGSIEKSIGSWLKIRGQGTLGLELDVVGGLQHLVADSKSAVVKGLVETIAKALGR